MSRWLLALLFAFGTVSFLTGCPAEKTDDAKTEEKKDDTATDDTKTDDTKTDDTKTDDTAK